MASREGSTLISHLIAQHLFVLHLRLGLVLNNYPSENDFALIAVVNRPSGYSSQSRWDELSKDPVDDLGFSGIELGQLLQRLVQIDDFACLLRRDDCGVLQFHLESAAPAPFGFLTPGVINEDLAHRSRGYGEKCARFCQLIRVWSARRK